MPNIPLKREVSEAERAADLQEELVEDETIVVTHMEEGNAKDDAMAKLKADQRAAEDRREEEHRLEQILSKEKEADAAMEHVMDEKVDLVTMEDGAEKEALRRQIAQDEKQATALLKEEESMELDFETDLKQHLEVEEMDRAALPNHLESIATAAEVQKRNGDGGGPLKLSIFSAHEKTQAGRKTKTTVTTASFKVPRCDPSTGW